VPSTTLSVGVFPPTGREDVVAKKYRVTLTAEERAGLEAMISKGRADARKLAHARILLQTDQADGAPTLTDQEVAAALDLSTRTVERVRRRFVEEGIESALSPKPTKRIYARVLDGAQEARLIALACSKAPEGKKRWTLRLLAERVVELGHGESLSHETVRRALQKTS
jgi:transposase